jgi:hypothetical protein
MATMEPDITLLLVMGKPPAATITGGNEGLATEKLVEIPAKAGVDFALFRT